MPQLLGWKDQVQADFAEVLGAASAAELPNRDAFRIAPIVG